MDINGVWASLNFPSMITGFCGRVYSQAKDPELGLAVTRAWNDWFFEEWYSAHPDRIVPMGITWLADPEIGAAEIRPQRRPGLPVGHAARTAPPHRVPVDLRRIVGADHRRVRRRPAPSSASTSARPACRSSRRAPRRCSSAPPFSARLSLTACAEWVWSAWAVKYPELKVAMSEGGIGWVGMLIDRLDNIVDRSGYGLDGFGGLRPADMLRRNFWFCTIDDPSTITTRHAIGIDHVMVEVDYPHGDGTWPDTQAVIERYWGDLPVEDLRKMTHENAARLYRHPLPEVCLP